MQDHLPCTRQALSSADLISDIIVSIRLYPTPPPSEDVDSQTFPLYKTPCLPKLAVSHEP